MFFSCRKWRLGLESYLKRMMVDSTRGRLTKFADKICRSSESTDRWTDTLSYLHRAAVLADGHDVVPVRGCCTYLQMADYCTYVVGCCTYARMDCCTYVVGLLYMRTDGCTDARMLCTRDVVQVCEREMEKTMHKETHRNA